MSTLTHLPVHGRIMPRYRRLGAKIPATDARKNVERCEAILEDDDGLAY